VKTVRITFANTIMLNKTLLVILLFFSLKIYAQTDTARSRPPVQPVQDSVVVRDTAAQAKIAVHTLSWQQDTLYTRLYRNLYAGNKKGAVFMINNMRQPGNKDELFYMLAGLFFLVAIIRSGFPKYFQNIFRLFFQSTYRQKQSKESLLQDNLPSLLLNIAFLLSGGLLIALLANGSPQVAQIPLWLLWLYTFGTLAIIYIGKYLFILFCGWAFNVPQFAFNYNFIVFLINKITGICLLPLLAIIAFSHGQMHDTAITVALSLVLLMLLYRYIVALGTVVKNLKISAVHFFIYLCAVEILPLLVIYKLLFIIIK
jgi:hypothetical protein